jgi:hypothetical protein
MSVATVILHGSYVGFYLMPVYNTEATKEQLLPDLLKTLKGKACFHIKTDAPELMKHIADTMEPGYRGYKEQGWM